jgi:hypothetical protein
VIIPVKFDVRVVPTVRRLHAFARTRGLAIEVLVCGALPAGVVSELPAVFVPVIPARKGACVRNGIVAANARTLLVCDADLPVSDDDLDRLLAASTVSPVVFASRTGMRTAVTGTSRFRMISSGLYRFLASALFGLRLDAQCGVKVFRREIARKLTIMQRLNGLLYDTEIALNCRSLNIAVTEVSVSIHNDEHSVINALEACVEVVVGLGILWFRSERSSRICPR